ncbi:PilZ domain-containing protein [Lachnospira multipara]|uniref:PilZ domain-containing protein n=1 Tax=Lachnospira multipara TaxID=28051 RepID=UPI000556A22B|nr:PilZ domain-containing protein [Lachnospira multipara]
MNDGIEKRRHRRVEADLKLVVSTLFKQNNVKIQNVDSPIRVINISKSGIGFESQSVFPIGFYFNAALRLGDEDSVLYCVVKIIRCQQLEDPDYYSYGCEFVGMSSILDYIFEEYEDEIDAKTK